MATNYLQKLVDAGSDTSGNGVQNKIIGGVDFGKSWNDADAAQLNLITQAAQTQTQLDMIADERAYNDPRSQVARMRAAGLNPDLQNIDAGTTQAGSPGSAPSSSGSPETNFVRDILPQIPQILNSALGVYSQIQGLRSNELDLMAKEQSLISGETSLFNDIGIKFLDDNEKHAEAIKAGQKSIAPDLNLYSDLFSPVYYSHRDKKRFQKSFIQYYSRNKDKIHQLYRDFRSSDAESKIRNAKTEGFVSKIESDPISSGLSAFLGPIVELGYNFEKSNYKEGILQNEYRSGIMKSEYNLSTAENSKSAPMRDLVSSLTESYNNGNVFSGIILAFIDMMSNGTIGNIAGQAQSVKNLAGSNRNKK